MTRRLLATAALAAAFAAPAVPASAALPCPDDPCVYICSDCLPDLTGRCYYLEPDFAAFCIPRA